MFEQANFFYNKLEQNKLLIVCEKAINLINKLIPLLSFYSFANKRE